MRSDFVLFSEDQSRVVVSASKANGHAVMEIARRSRIPAAVVGRVGGDRLVIGKEIDIPVSEISDAYMRSIGERMERDETGLF
jgi:phosphoribosylformylglycinamidine synthase